ncbi:MAG: threonine--tRNA ligase [Parcubacteria bacterium C7867-001]|nr:MAG: threonine--tRNA ligase [Parcubacteria bacterium C7867-001]
MEPSQEKENDHKRLGRELDLFTFSPTVGKGLPLWTPKGATIRRELERFIVDEEIKRGYEHVYTPDMAKLELYEKSGHYPHYKDGMYAPIEDEDEKFMLRPMTCPHHFELFLRAPHSYREFPVRYAEIAKLYRYEQSGELMGLQRVRSFCLSDAHVICSSEEQAVEEVAKALDLIEYANGVLGLEMGKDYTYRLSLGDRADTEKYYKDDAGWEKAEALLRECMQKRGVDFVEAAGEAAFYGPKIDIQMKNVNGKEDTAFTVQYDLSSPKKFDLVYMGEDGKEHGCFVVHRSSIGSIERIIAFLIEKYAGAFPLWLSPVHARILPVSEKHSEYAYQVLASLKEAGLRVELDESNETLGKKIRNAKTEKIPYLLVVGDKEIEDSTVSVDSRDHGKLDAMSVGDFTARTEDEIKKRVR